MGDPFKQFWQLLTWPVRALTPSQKAVNEQTKAVMFYGWPILVILFGIAMATITQRPDWGLDKVVMGIVIAVIGGYWLYRRCGGRRLF